MWGGYTGPGSKTVIPARASAKVSFRLVPHQSPGKIMAGLREFLEARLPPDCRFDLISHAASAGAAHLRRLAVRQCRAPFS
jgi:acetylornithine deacetylase/succinyl-diaminopimelate desuccinylase-like protein